MYNMKEIRALKALINTQKEIIINSKTINDNLLSEFNKIEKLLPEDDIKEDKYPQKIHFNGNNLEIIQYTNGGKYILWSIDTSEDIGCGIGFNINENPNDYRIVKGIILVATKIGDFAEKYGLEKDNKDIEYYLYTNPFSIDTINGKLRHHDIKKAVEDFNKITID